MPDAPIVAVRGETHLEVDPEIATITATVSARSADRERTLRLLGERNDALRALVDGFAAAVERRESAGVSVRPEYGRSSAERVKGYVGQATTTIVVRDFTVLGDLFLALAGQEATEVYGPWWGLRPDSPAYQQARRAALGDAIDRARDYAQALGVDLVALVELADSGLGRSEPVPRMFAADAVRSVSGAPELNLDPERQRVYASVEARFTTTAPDVAKL
jgi:uncharacterized protein YggE